MSINCNPDWNLRVIKHDDVDENEETFYSIEEVHYDDMGEADAVSSDYHIETESYEQLKEEILEITKAFDLPVISESDFLNDYYPYNTEFGSNITEEEMIEIDINNQRLTAITEMIKKYSNDMELGALVRKIFNEPVGEQLELNFED